MKCNIFLKKSQKQQDKVVSLLEAELNAVMVFLTLLFTYSPIFSSRFLSYVELIQLCENYFEFTL